VKLFVLRNELPRNRICFTFSRGFGTAVERNRVRRLGREAYRNLKPGLRCGFDFILMVYPDNSGLTFTGYKEQLRFLMVKAGVLL
jgi:ribonuclease P protein component